MADARAEDPEIRFDDLLGPRGSVAPLNSESLAGFIRGAVESEPDGATSELDELIPAEATDFHHHGEVVGEGGEDYLEAHDGDFVDDSFSGFHDLPDPSHEQSDRSDTDDVVEEGFEF